MAKARRATRRRPTGDGRQSPTADSERRESGGFLAQLGLFETGNGLPHGPSVVVLAIITAVVVYPISRLVRFVLRR